jgi:hypothetical protein
MANFANWNRNQPSNSSLARDFPSLHRSDKSILEETLNEEHYFTSGSAGSAGIHRPGSARPFVGIRSQVSGGAARSGRLMWAADTGSLHFLGAASSSHSTIVPVPNQFSVITSHRTIPSIPANGVAVQSSFSMAGLTSNHLIVVNPRAPTNQVLMQARPNLFDPTVDITSYNPSSVTFTDVGVLIMAIRPNF